jgi:mRNA interferase MazF
VISSDLFAPIPLRIAIPITSWQDKFGDRPFMVKLEANLSNGLDRDSAGNVLQIRSLSTERSVRRIGQVSPEVFKELLAGLVICVDYQA